MSCDTCGITTSLDSLSALLWVPGGSGRLETKYLQLQCSMVACVYIPYRLNLNLLCSCIAAHRLSYTFMAAVADQSVFNFLMALPSLSLMSS